MAFITVLLGGARSGKSSLALQLGEQASDVSFIATATAGDDDMTRRIQRHRDERPRQWTTIEEPLDLPGAIARADPHHLVIVDCITLWVTNLLLAEQPEAEVLGSTVTAIDALRARTGDAVLVTNEVGLGIVPQTPLGRVFRDVLGRVNSSLVSAADTAMLLVAGRALELRPPSEVLTSSRTGRP